MLTVFISLALLSSALCSKILVVVPLPARSHANLFDPLVEELSKNGHEVTFITAFPLKKPLKNVEEIAFDPSSFKPMKKEEDGKDVRF